MGIDNNKKLKAVILVGGAQKGTRFRPLSLQLPKPLFPIAGIPLIEHHISQLCQLPEIVEIFLLGFYPEEAFAEFIAECKTKYARVPLRYLKEQQPLGTAGGLLAHLDVLIKDKPAGIFVLNADVCGDLPLAEMAKELERQQPKAKCLILTTEATREQSVNFGSVAIDSSTTEGGEGGGGPSDSGGRVLHYVDKPTTFVSTHISCGVYLLKGSTMGDQLEMAAKMAAQRNVNNGPSSPNSQHLQSGQVWFEVNLFPQMASNGTLFAWHTQRWWSQTKSAAAVLYANRHYLRLYREREPQRLSTNISCQILGDVFIDPSAIVDSSAKIGPNVSIGPNVQIKAGVRIRESIVLANAIIDEHCCILHSVIGWRSHIGAWSRVEGSPIAPNPNVPFAKLDNKPMFNMDGRLNPSITILGSDVNIGRELVLLNSVILPYKDLTAGCKNQIIL